MQERLVSGRFLGHAIHRRNALGAEYSDTTYGSASKSQTAVVMPEPRLALQGACIIPHCAHRVGAMGPGSACDPTSVC
jgi:hypothetical protein